MALIERLLARGGYVRAPAAADMRSASPQNSGISLENPNVPISPEALAVLMAGGPTAAGPAVGERSSMRSTVVFACVSLVSGLLGSLPVGVYEDDGGSRKPLPDDPMAQLLGGSPNPDIGLSSFIWRELMGVHLNLNGNHYSVKEYNNAGDVVGIVPLNPNATDVVGIREGMGWRRRYFTRLSDGDVYQIEQEDMIHVPGPGFDGLKGLSPIQFAGRQAIGAALAMEESQSRFLASGARPSGVVTQGAGKALSTDALNLVKSEFAALYQGSHNAGGVVFLDNGMTFNALQMSMKDAELLESRKYTAVDICRIFGVPPFLVGETADMTAWGSGLEQIMTAFKMLCLNRWLSRIEAELKLKLFTPGRNYALFDRDALNATNAQAQADYFSKMSGAGLTLNEIRRSLHKPPVPGGDVPLVPANYQTLDRAINGPVPTDPAAPSPA